MLPHKDFFKAMIDGDIDHASHTDIRFAEALLYLDRKVSVLTRNVMSEERLDEILQSEIQFIQQEIVELQRPKIVRLQLVITQPEAPAEGDSAMPKLITAVPVWDDGFTGFDTGMHQQPADFTVVFSDPDGGTLSNNTFNTVQLDANTETVDHVTGVYTGTAAVSGSATGENDVQNPPPAAKIASLNLNVSDI